ncbi:MAG: hypothetical protein WCR20_08540, partial [Verrucomicrobiota bacterium]
EESKEAFLKEYNSNHFVRAEELEMEIDSMKTKLEDVINEEKKLLNAEIKRINKNIKDLDNSYNLQVEVRNKKKMIELERKIIEATESVDKLKAKKSDNFYDEVKWEKKEIKYLLYKYEKIKHNPKKEAKIRNEIEYERLEDKLSTLYKELEKI